MNPIVSIIIPNKNQKEYLSKCIKSILENTTQNHIKDFEIIILENNSDEESIFEYYKELENNPRIKILTYNKVFNWSAINNFGAKHANGDYLVFLNNDTQVVTPQWLDYTIILFKNDSEIGIAGTTLWYENITVQHAGVKLNSQGNPFHNDLRMSEEIFYKKYKYDNKTRQVHAVTGACLITKKEIFDKLKGFDEKYPLALSDIDYCMKINNKGLKCVWIPYIALYHYESKTRGYEDTEEKKKRFLKETKYFHHKWSSLIKSGKLVYDDALPITNIVITTFNNEKYIQQSLPNILEKASNKYPYLVTIIDNGSKDGTVEYLKEQYEEGNIDTLILLKENIGVAKGQNIGWSMFKDCDLTMKYDPDVIMEKDNWLDDMVEIITKYTRIGALGYNCENTSYPLVDVEGKKFRHKNGNIGGASFLMRRDVIQHLGYWCEELGLYGEEDALCGAKISAVGLLNCYMEDEKCMIHLPDIDPEYRKFKDEERAENLKENSNFRRILNNYRLGRIQKDEATPYENYNFEFFSRIKDIK